MIVMKLGARVTSFQILPSKVESHFVPRILMTAITTIHPRILEDPENMVRRQQLDDLDHYKQAPKKKKKKISHGFGFKQKQNVWLV